MWTIPEQLIAMFGGTQDIMDIICFFPWNVYIFHCILSPTPVFFSRNLLYCSKRKHDITGERKQCQNFYQSVSFLYGCFSESCWQAVEILLPPMKNLRYILRPESSPRRPPAKKHWAYKGKPVERRGRKAMGLRSEGWLWQPVAALNSDLMTYSDNIYEQESVC